MKFVILAIISLTIAYSGEIFAEADWRRKPVQCGPVDTVEKIVDGAGEEFLLRGNGIAFDSSGKRFPVKVGLWTNLETGTFTIVETDGTEICVISFGDNINFEINVPEDES